MAIGEAGSATAHSPTENVPITVTLTEPLTDPVFALSATKNGGNQFAWRITDQTHQGGVYVGKKGCETSHDFGLYIIN